MELEDSVLAEVSFRGGQTLSKPSPSITRHQPCGGERKGDEGLVKVKHGHQSAHRNPSSPSAAAEVAVSS